MVDGALVDVMDENVAGEELLAIKLLDGVTEEPGAELAEIVGGSGLSGPAFSITRAASAAASSGAMAAWMSARASADARVATASLSTN